MTQIINLTKLYNILHLHKTEKENLPWNRSDINFQMAPDQFELSTLICIFVPNSGLSFHLEQSWQHVAVKCWTMYLNWAILNSLLKVRLRVNSLIGLHHRSTDTMLLASPMTVFNQAQTSTAKSISLAISHLGVHKCVRSICQLIKPI